MGTIGVIGDRNHLSRFGGSCRIRPYGRMQLPLVYHYTKAIDVKPGRMIFHFYLSNVRYNSDTSVNVLQYIHLRDRG